MTPATDAAQLSQHDMAAILAVTRALAAPFDLRTMLAEVTAAACAVLHAERSLVWLHDAARDEMVLEISSDLSQVRVPTGSGLVGACARERRPVNVPDCYADPRFDPSVDRRSGFHTRCSLTMPLVDHRAQFIGVMQVLNKAGGVFEGGDEVLAEALAAQCAVALSRVRMTEALIEAEKVQRELELARELQQSSLPSALPIVAGYDMHATFLPASLTGGDTYDLMLAEQGLLVVIGDATGHGIAPALSVTRMHAMLRMALALGADLETAFRRVNDQLAHTLPAGHFVTAFIGLLDAAAHRLRFISGGQSPILHWHAADGRCTLHKAGSFPMGAMPIRTLRPAVAIDFGTGDVLALLTDGVYEQENGRGEQFGLARVEALIGVHAGGSVAVLAGHLLAAVRAFADAELQEDDVTMVLLKRLS